MNSDNKWIKLHSKLLNWEWYKDNNTKALFIHCLLKANWKEAKFQGIDVSRGSFITGRKQLAKELNLSEQNVKTSLNHLKSTNEITIKSTNKFSIITVVNYEKYQENNQLANQQLTSNQPATNQQLTTIEEYKNIDYISTTTNNKAGEAIFDLVQKEFGRVLSPMEYEIVNSWLEMKLPEELILNAIKEATLNNAKSCKYIQRILERYKREGVKTVSEAQQSYFNEESKKTEAIELFDYDWLNESEE